MRRTASYLLRNYITDSVDAILGRLIVRSKLPRLQMLDIDILGPAAFIFMSSVTLLEAGGLSNMRLDEVHPCAKACLVAPLVGVLKP